MKVMKTKQIFKTKFGGLIMKKQTALLSLVILVAQLALAAGPVARESGAKTREKEKTVTESVESKSRNVLESLSQEQAADSAKKAEKVLGFENPNLAEMIQKNPNMKAFIDVTLELFQKGSKRTQAESDMLTGHMEILRVLGKNRTYGKLSNKEKKEIRFALKFIEMQGQYKAYGELPTQQLWGALVGAKVKSGALLTDAVRDGAKEVFKLKTDKEAEKFMEDTETCRL